MYFHHGAFVLTTKEQCKYQAKCILATICFQWTTWMVMQQHFTQNTTILIGTLLPYHMHTVNKWVLPWCHSSSQQKAETTNHQMLASIYEDKEISNNLSNNHAVYFHSVTTVHIDWKSSQLSLRLV